MAELHLHVTYTFGQGERDAFLAAIAESGVQATIRAEKGCLRYDYFLPVEDDGKLVLLEAWESAEAQRTHLAQPHMDIVRGLKERFHADAVLEEFTPRNA